MTQSNKVYFVSSRGYLSTTYLLLRNQGTEIFMDIYLRKDKTTATIQGGTDGDLNRGLLSETSPRPHPSLAALGLISRLQEGRLQEGRTYSSPCFHQCRTDRSPRRRFPLVKFIGNTLFPDDVGALPLPLSVGAPQLILGGLRR